jgi:hypothetical protein
VLQRLHGGWSQAKLAQALALRIHIRDRKCDMPYPSPRS